LEVRVEDRLKTNAEMIDGIYSGISPKQGDPLWGMATLKAKRSGLPVDLWLDDSVAYKRGGHAMRIKFQPERGCSSITHDFVPMTISDEPEVLGEHRLSARDIRVIKDFVKRNKKALEDLSDGLIDFIEFIERMK
jgi:hypothetical protein